MKIYQVFLLSLLLIITSCNQNQNDTSNQQQNKQKQEMKIVKDQGVITKVSSQNFEDTYSALVKVITNNPNLKMVAQLDHQANAASVGLKLNPTKIIMFGNPKLGTPLMQSAQTTGLDLPQKILISQDDHGVVKVSYNDPVYLKNRHGIEGRDEVLVKVSAALDNITNAVIKL